MNSERTCVSQGFVQVGGRRPEKKKLYNEELHGLYAAPNIVRVIKSKRTRWAGHVIQMIEMRNTKFLSENLKRDETTRKT